MLVTSSQAPQNPKAMDHIFNLYVGFIAVQNMCGLLPNIDVK